MCLPIWADAAAFLLELYNILNCFPALVIVLPLQVWNTEKFSLRRDFYFWKVFFFTARTGENVTLCNNKGTLPFFFTLLSWKTGFDYSPNIIFWHLIVFKTEKKFMLWKKKRKIQWVQGKFNEYNRIRKEILIVLVMTCKSRRVKKTENF